MSHAQDPANSREDRVNQIIAAFLDAERAGQAPSTDELLRQHPECAADLKSFLADRQHFQKFAAPLDAVGSPRPAAGDAPTLGVDQTAAAVGTTVRYFGDYELLEEIARGGMGVVFKARQVSLNRTVALKMILAGQLASQDDIQRFKREAQAAANLDHPNIVPIYEVGEHQGQQYFSMKLVEGGSLAACGAAHKPATTAREEHRRVAELIVKVARAVHHAHQRGILHRDLKPGNILLDQDGEPLVTDFGLAKPMASGVASAPRDADARGALTQPRSPDALTQTGAIVGTPAYMAPEQAQAKKDLTVAVDVYSLGAILYELLTGQPPFRGDTPLDIILQLLHREPESPRKITPALDRDLEIVCLKCLQKQPDKRYASSAALADDLQRWLHGEPIEARPATRRERLVKWVRRQPAVAALIGVSAAAALVLLVGGTIFNAQLQIALIDVADKEAKLHLAKVAADEKEKELTGANDAANKAVLESNKQLTQAESLKLVAHAELLRPTNASLALLLAVEAAQRSPERLAVHNNALLACMQAIPDHKVFPMPKGTVASARLSLDGTKLLTLHGYVNGLIHPDLPLGGQNPAVRIWDVASGKELIVLKVPKGGHKEPFVFSNAEFSPDGQRVLTTFLGDSICRYQDGSLFHYSDRVVRLWDTATAKEVLSLKGHTGTVTSARFSADGKKIITASPDQTIRIWDAATGKQLVQLDVPDSKQIPVAALLSPDGRRVVAWHRIYFYTKQTFALTKTGKAVEPVDPPFRHEGLDTAFKMNGEITVKGTYGSLGGGNTPLLMWDLQKPGTPAIWNDKLAEWWDSISFAGNTGLVAMGDDGRVTWRDVRTGKETKTRTLKFRGDRDVDLHADSNMALKWEGNKLWVQHMEHHKPQLLLAHEQYIHDAHFSPDGRFIVSAGADDTVRLWPLHPSPPTPWREVPLNLSNAFLCWQPAQSAPLLVHHHRLHSPFKEFHLIKLLQGTAWPKELGPPKSGPRTISLSPDGKKLAVAYSPTSGAAGKLFVYDTTNGKQLLAMDSTPGGGRTVQFSPDGKALLLSPDFYHYDFAELFHPPGKVVVIDAASGKSVKVLYSAKDDRVTARWHPGGEMIYVREHGEPAYLLDAASGAKRVTFAEPIWSEPYFAVFSPDGKQLLEGAPGILYLWDIKTGVKLHEWKTSSNAMSNNLISQIVQNPEQHRLASFSPDGKLLALAGILDGAATITLWDADTHKLLRTLHGHTGIVRAVAFSPDGKWLVSAGKDSTARVWYTDTGREYVTLPHEMNVVAVGFSGDSKYVHTVTAANLGQLHLAQTWPLDLLPTAWAVQHRELTADERQLYGVGPPAKIKKMPAPLIPPSSAEWAHLLWHLDRVKALARGGLLELAKSDMDRVSKQLTDGPVNFDMFIARHDVAVIRLGLLNDLAGYRKECAAALKLVEKPTELNKAKLNSIAWLCCLGPDAVADLPGLLKKAETEWAGQTDLGLLNTLGALQFRAGKLTQAAQTLEKILAQRQKKEEEPFDALFLALIYHKLKDPKKAQEFLDRARKAMDEHASWLEGMSWPNNLDLPILLREAESLIEPAKKQPVNL